MGEKDDISNAYRGSMTIEMTYLMPVVIMMIVLMVYVWMHLHNGYVLEQTIERVIIDMERERDSSNSELEEGIRKRITEELERGLLAVKNYQVSVNVNLFTIQVSGSYQMYVSLISLLDEIATSNLFADTYTGTIRRENPASLIRIYRALEELFMEEETTNDTA